MGFMAMAATSSKTPTHLPFFTGQSGSHLTWHYLTPVKFILGVLRAAISYTSQRPYSYSLFPGSTLEISCRSTDLKEIALSQEDGLVIPAFFRVGTKSFRSFWRHIAFEPLWDQGHL